MNGRHGYQGWGADQAPHRNSVYSYQQHSHPDRRGQSTSWGNEYAVGWASEAYHPNYYEAYYPPPSHLYAPSPGSHPSYSPYYDAEYPSDRYAEQPTAYARDHRADTSSRSVRQGHPSRDPPSGQSPPAPRHTHQYSTRSQPRGRMVSYLRSKPRERYHRRTIEPPANYPSEREPPGPLPLLVLDLNGTLVNRGSSAKGSASDRSRRPVLRPYLKSFLQYCLGVQGADGSLDQHHDAWDKREASRATDAEESGPHGSHFWRSCEEPKARPGAKFRLLLWSSAQPHNVDSMARAILSPEQAEQLLRVYARDTLVTKHLYWQKAPSVKDLEILWAVLNSKTLGKKAEARLLAEARHREDEQSPDVDGPADEEASGAGHLAAKLAEKNVRMANVKSDGQYSDGKGYGQHNTLLLDDSIDKARLQPFNHILLPEFDQPRAVKSVKTAQGGGEGEGEGEGEVDDVLLQVVGVLEHARYQVNVSSWIRFGGLGNFGGMAEQHPFYLDDEDSAMEVDEAIIEQAARYFAQPASASPSHAGPRLHASTNERSEAFWVQEGRRALEHHHIPLLRF